MTTKAPDFVEMNALALEACDMWQEHLSNFAQDPAARAELTRFLEPQRRMLADWASLMQQGAAHVRSRENPDVADDGRAAPATAGSDLSNATAPAGSAAGSASAATPKSVASPVDDSLRVAQLALRLAELEKRVERLESVANPDAPRNA